MNITVFLTHNTIHEWTISTAQLDRLRAIDGATVRHCTTLEEFRKALPDTEVALTWVFRQAWFAEAPRLRLLSTPSAGHERVPVTPPARVQLRYGSFHGAIISQTVLAWMLGWARGTLPYATVMRSSGVQEFRSSEWPEERFTNRAKTLTGAHLLILGFGNIGQAIAKHALHFGMRVTGVRRHIDRNRPQSTAIDCNRKIPVHSMDSLDTLLPTADYLVLVLPGDASTDNILDDCRLRLLPPHAFVCNVGRGNAIDEDALALALTEKRLGGAALDVFRTEPLSDGSPLRRAPSCFLFPHVSAVAPEYLDLYLDGIIPMIYSALA